MGTQIKIAGQIIKQEGDYALALKDNHGDLYKEVKATFALAEKEAFAHVQTESERLVEKGHGRLEIRVEWTIRDPEIVNSLDPEKMWQAFGMVRAERRIDQAISRETRSFLLSFPEVATFAHTVRSH